MRKKYRFVTLRFYEQFELHRFLKKYNIDYTINTKAMDSCEFYLYSDMKNTTEVFNEAKKLKDMEIISGFSLIDIENEFTEDELEHAEWIEIEVKTRSLNAEPSNCGRYREIYYEIEEGCEQCRYSYNQTGYISLKKSLKFTKKRKITGLLNVMGEFFINDEVKNKLEESDLTGFEIWPVYNLKRTEYLKNTYQVHVNETLNFSMEPESYAEKIVCDVCGMEYYVSNIDRSQIAYKRKLFHNVHSDIVRTREKTGLAFYESNTLISHNMYIFLKKHDMLKDIRMNVVVLKD